MALTISVPTYGPVPPGNERMVINTVTPDNNYPTGGYPITPAMFGLSIIKFIIADTSDNGSGAYVIPKYRYAAGKLQYVTITAGALAEVNNGTDLSLYASRLLIFGV